MKKPKSQPLVLHVHSPLSRAASLVRSRISSEFETRESADVGDLQPSIRDQREIRKGRNTPVE